MLIARTREGSGVCCWCFCFGVFLGMDAPRPQSGEMRGRLTFHVFAHVSALIADQADRLITTSVFVFVLVLVLVTGNNIIYI